MSDNSIDRYTTLPSGTTICFRVCGDEADPVILLIAGLGEDLTFWGDSFTGSLIAQGFRVITMDNRDVGQSTFAATPAPGYGVN
ncbi:alpha/beta hydrolase domain protein [Mycobacteroides abscessus subsp. bolletii 1513]|uniref:Alpha/beta hydrolase domain protein n=1 Tax=Mycobacteroides abscessus subsp. bolletii 1513 TaxID=1299321 RepID=X8DGY9_9MYCO|nr:alpha/beta hydrolase domain protein [Mycobacteroides abscessus subsp. bolletii 1513]